MFRHKFTKQLTILLIFLVVVTVSTVVIVAYFKYYTDKNYIGETPTDNWQTTTKININLKINKLKLLCWITTKPNNYEKALAVRNTWCRRCDKCIFMSSANDPRLPSVNLNIPERRGNLWAKTKAALKYVYDNDYENYDWFLKADDDTYVIVENLRSFLLQQVPSEPTYFGAKFRLLVSQGFMSGGAGYVIPKQVLKKFVTEGLQDNGPCSKASEDAEDVQFGKCMEKIGVKAGDDRDQLNRHRFLPEPPVFFFNNRGPTWLDAYSFYPLKMGMDCCSDSVISFHRISPSMMNEIEYLIYRVRVSDGIS